MVFTKVGNVVHYKKSKGMTKKMNEKEEYDG